MSLISSSAWRRRVRRLKGITKRNQNPLPQCQIESGVGLIVSEQASEEGNQGIAQRKPQAKPVHGRPFVQRAAAKRDHDSGKSGQCRRDLGGRREGFPWLHWPGLNRNQASRAIPNFALLLCTNQNPVDSWCISIRRSLLWSLILPMAQTTRWRRLRKLRCGLGSVAAWASTIIAGIGGLGLIITQGPLPLTNAGSPWSQRSQRVRERPGS